MYMLANKSTNERIILFFATDGGQFSVWMERFAHLSSLIEIDSLGHNLGLF